LQFQRLEDLALRHVGETLMHHALQQDSYRDESEIAVHHARAGLVLEIEICDRARGTIRLVLG
jgi:hypothetical protein